MPKRVDITGTVYGHLTVRGLTEKVKGQRARQWIVDCAACRAESKLASDILVDGLICTSTMLRAGMVTSCGCKPRLNLRGFNLVKRMKSSGQRLCKSLPASVSANPEIRFFLEPSGRTVHKLAAESAIAALELKPLGDGLFSDQSQTWVAP